jgi:Gpi18-like mannosyltransferase
MQTIKNTLRNLHFDDLSGHWFWKAILFPFLTTRLCWVLVAYYAVGNYLPNPTYQRYVTRGFFLTHIFPIDIFTRWDAGAYFSILSQGYHPSSDLRTVFSNIAFFPLYPYLVKSFGWLGLSLPDGFYVAFGVLLSNLFYIAAAVLLYRLIIHEFGFSVQTATRTLGLLIVFPTSFIFSSFYTESLFLFITILGLTFAFQNKWGLAALMAFFALLTRSQGLVVWGALCLLYLERKNWNLKQIKPDVAWLFLAPIGLLAHLYSLYKLTGEPLAPFVAMTAWGRANSSIIANLRENLASPFLDIYKIDLVLTIIFIAASIYILWKWPIKSIGLLSLALSVMPIASGLLVSVSRYLLLVFPVFILFGEKLHKPQVYDLVRTICFSLQIIYFAGWVNYYWIV